MFMYLDKAYTFASTLNLQTYTYVYHLCINVHNIMHTHLYMSMFVCKNMFKGVMLVHSEIKKQKVKCP